MEDLPLIPATTADSSPRSVAVEPFPLGSAAGVVAALSAISAATTVAIAEIVLGGDRALFVERNNIHPTARLALIVAVLASAVVPPVWVLPRLVRHKARAVTDLRRLTERLCPLLVAWAIPPLLTREAWTDHPLGHLILLSLVVLTLERLLRISLSSIPLQGATWSERVTRRVPRSVRRLAPPLLVAGAAFAYATYTAYYSIQEHHRFQTGGYDLGIYTSLIRNLVYGRFFVSPILNPDVSYLSHHAEFGSLYLVPIYALFPRAETLLIIQSLALGVAAIPLYFFAKTQVATVPAFLFSFAYLLFAPVHGANFYDFHWMPLTVPVWFTLFFAIATRRMWLVLLSVAIVLPMREETGLMLAALGFLLAASAYWPRLGLGFCAVGIGWFFLMRGVVVPSHGDAGFAGIYKNLVPAGETGFGAVIKTLLANPNFVWTTLATEPKLKYVLHMLGPLAFLPVRRPAFILLLIPGSLFTLITTDYEPTVSIAFQYVTHWVPWLFAGAVLTVRHFAKGPNPFAYQRSAVIAAFVGVFCHSYAFGAILQHESFMGGFHRVSFQMNAEDEARYAEFLRIVAKLPANARVAATDPQSPHLGAWVDVCTLRITNCHAEYLLISRRHFASEDRRNVRLALQAAPYGLVDKLGDFYLFQRDHVSNRTERALKDLSLSP